MRALTKTSPTGTHIGAPNHRTPDYTDRASKGDTSGTHFARAYSHGPCVAPANPRPPGALPKCAIAVPGQVRIISGVTEAGAQELPEAEKILIAGRFRLEAYLAKGGVGAVYRALDESTGRSVALKRMLTHASTSERLRTLFQREFHTLARLKHPRIIEVYDYGTEGRIPYYTMELLDGADLGESAPIPYQKACFYLRDVASSLALLHSRHLLHRDLSARNVRLTGDDRCKLLDFGTMASFGMATEIVGTPPLVAPESMRGTPLDHRTDLYSLGSLAYRILTRRYAYKARQLEDLPELWRTAPPPPSAITPDIPESLDRLVMSMLDLNPILRPRNASEVIDRLTAIGNLDPDPDAVETAQSYFLGSRLVGRDQQMERLDKRVKRAVGGSGATVIIEGNPGVGKTRLMEEAGLQAQLLGALTLRVDARAHAGPSGVALALANSLLHTAPVEARRAVEPHINVLAPLLPSLSGETTGTGVTPSVDLPVFQNAMHEWFVAMSGHQPLVILVDDLPRVDESSGALLAALARSAPDKPLLLIGTRRLAGNVMAPRAVQTLLSAARRLRLHRLKRDGTGELVESLFGRVPNADKMATWIHDLTTGSPMQTMELAQHLVDTGVIRYTGGMWVLPIEIPKQALPKNLAATMHARAAALPEDIRALAEALSVRRGVLPLELCVAMSGQDDAEAVFAQVDELAARGVLVSAAGGYAFAQEALRETLLAELGKARSKALHLRLAEALLDSNRADASTKLEAGWNLMRAGQDTRGATMLADAVRNLTPRGDAIAASIPALETALEVFEREGRPPYQCSRLRLALVSSYDRVACRRHGQRTFDEMTHAAGIGFMRALQPILGRRFGMNVGVLLATLRHMFTPASQQHVHPVLAIGYMYRCAYGLLAVASSTMQTELLQRLLDDLKRFRTVPGIGELTQRMFETSVLSIQGRPNRSRRAALRARELLEAGPIEGMDESAFRGIQAGAFISHGMAEAVSSISGAATLGVAEDLEKLTEAQTGSEVSLDGYMTAPELERAALQIRLVHHTLRGESDAAAELRHTLEVKALQSGMFWQFDLWRLLLEMTAASRSGDLTTMRRNLEQLRSMPGEGTELAPLVVQFQYTLLNGLGKYEEHLNQEQQVLASGLTPGEATGWDSRLDGLAHSLIRTGKPGRAIKLLTAALKEPFDDRDPESVGLMLLQARLALAKAADGDARGAQGLLDDLVRRSESSDHPMLRGLIHEAGARIAWQRDDSDLFEAHVQHMRHWYTITHNPALLSRGQRVASLFRQQAVPAPSSPDGPIEVITRVSTKRALEGVDALMSDCRDADERAVRALHLIIEQAAGTAGHLYLLKRERLRLAASFEADEPQDELEIAIIKQVKQQRERDEEPRTIDASTTAQSAVVTLADDEGPGSQFVTILLQTSGVPRRIVGAVALQATTDILHPVREVYLEALSECLREDAVRSVPPPAAV